MGSHHAPTADCAQPSLALPTAARISCALELHISGCKVMAISSDDGFQDHALQPLCGTPRAKSPNRVMALLVFSSTVAQGVRAVPKQLIENFNIVSCQDRLVTGKLRNDFGKNFQDVDSVRGWSHVLLKVNGSDPRHTGPSKQSCRT